MQRQDFAAELNDLSHQVVGCAIEVHRHLGPGLLESLYEEAMAYELRARSIPHVRQMDIQVPYKDTVLRGQRVDLVVAGQIVVELKSVTKTQEIHRAQLLSYLRATGMPLGLLINFNVVLLKDDLHRVINERSKFAGINGAASPSRPS